MHITKVIGNRSNGKCQFNGLKIVRGIYLRRSENMDKKLTILFVVTIFVFSGCENNTGVVPMGEGTFMVACQAATGFVLSWT